MNYSDIKNKLKNFPAKHLLLTKVILFDAESLLTRANQKVQFFEENNLQNEKYIGLKASNSVEYLVYVFTMWELGITPVLFNDRWTESESLDIAEKYGIRTIIIFEDPFGSKVKIRKTGFESASVPKDDTAVIIFTSGTSGLPKAVEISFDNLASNFQKVKQLANITEDDIWVASLPFYHIGGFAIIIRGIMGNNSIVVPETLKPEHLNFSAEMFDATLISLVPTTLKYYMDIFPEKLKPYKHVFLGGGHAGVKLINDALWYGINVTKVYGSTETTAMIVAATTPELQVNPDTVGKALDDVEIKILDEEGGELKFNNTGLIGVKSDTIANGYFLDEELWEKRFRGDYFLTGDYGKKDIAGNLYIELRREDLIVTGGENVNPREVENELNQIDKINNSYVFGVEDEQWGQIVCALIESAEEIDIPTIKEQLKIKLASYKIPKRFAVTEKLPRNSVGKVEKQKAVTYLIENEIS